MREIIPKFTKQEQTAAVELNAKIRKFVIRLKKVPRFASHWSVFTSYQTRQIRLTYKKRGKRKAAKEFAAINKWFTKGKLLPPEVQLVHMV